MKFINTDGVVFVGTGSEWFWAALTGLVLAGTFVAIYRQLRLQRVQMRENNKVLRSQAHYNALSLLQRPWELLIEDVGVSVGPAPYSTSQLEQVALGNIFATYQIVADSQPYSFAGGTRESYEFTATGSHGAAQGNAHGCLTVDSIATAAGGYGGDTYVYFSTESTWGQYEHILHLVLAHLTFQGRSVNG